MKAIVCEMCGSNDLIKKDGFYVCQNCGTKYTVDEAKKLLVEGTVTIDNTKTVSNQYIIARRSLDAGDYSAAGELYKKVLEHNPNDWEATFYSVYCRAVECKLGEMKAYIELVNNAAIRAYALLLKEDKETQCKGAAIVGLRLLSLFLLYTDAEQKNYVEFSDLNGRRDQHYDFIRDIYSSLWAHGQTIYDQFEHTEEVINAAVQCWKSGITVALKIWNAYTNKNAMRQSIAKYEEKIKKHDPSYVAPVPGGTSISGNNGNTSGGCYVATCVYSSYDCPEVWLLRRFRDKCLKKTFFGRMFIKVYYYISPKVVEKFGNNEKFRSFNKRVLDKIVIILHKEGFQDSFYIDE